MGTAENSRSRGLHRWLVAIAALLALDIQPADARGFRGRCRRTRCCVQADCRPQPRCCPATYTPCYASCICVIYQYLDFGNGTQVYYAHEHDECTPEQCPYYTGILYSGSYLDTNEICPDCQGGARGNVYAQEPDPALDRVKEPDYDLYTDPDPLKIVEGGDVRVVPIDTYQVIFRDPDTRAPRFARVFEMNFKKRGFPDRNFAIGVEVSTLTEAPKYTKSAEHYRGKSHMYKIAIEPGNRECVILTP